MEMKKIRKWIAVTACLSMIVIQKVPMTVQAEVVEQIMPLMTYISGYSAELRISDTGKATIQAFVLSNNTSNYIKATLQKKSGNSWINVKSWEISEHGSCTSVTETYSVSKGTYRVKATIKANSETVHATSASKTY